MTDTDKQIASVQAWIQTNLDPESLEELQKPPGFSAELEAQYEAEQEARAWLSVNFSDKAISELEDAMLYLPETFFEELRAKLRKLEDKQDD